MEEDKPKFAILPDENGFAVTYNSKIVFFTNKITDKYYYFTYIQDDSVPIDQIIHKDFKVKPDKISEFFTDINDQVNNNISINNLSIKKQYV